MFVRDNALYRLWGIAGESAAFSAACLRCLWENPSEWNGQALVKLAPLFTVTLLLLRKKDPATLLLYASTAGILAVLLPGPAAALLPCALTLASVGGIRLASYAAAMGRFLLGGGKPACIGAAAAAIAGFALALLPWEWMLPSSAGFLLLSGLRFPLRPLHLTRLLAYDRRPPDDSMEALHAQLSEYLHCRRKRRRLIYVLKAGVRLFYRCRVEGAQNLPHKPESLVFLCNHGIVAGAVITRLYLPVPFRSWSVSDLMEPEDAEEHIRRFIVEPAAWIKPRFRSPAVKLLKRVSLWLFDSIDSIPVYRFRLRKITQTFRLTSQALKAGDNVMIFPENPDHESLPKPGYCSDHILPFFSGFVTAIHLYQEQTGREVTYVPCYAGGHQLIIGTPFQSRKDLPFTEEKERVVALAEAAIHALSESHGGPSRTPTSAQA